MFVIIDQETGKPYRVWHGSNTLMRIYESEASANRVAKELMNRYNNYNYRKTPLVLTVHPITVGEALS